MIATTFPSGASESYGYDADSNLTSKTDRKGQAIQYVYDALNRLTQKTYPDSTTAAYTYDLVGKILQVNDPTGTYGFAYDNMGRLVGTIPNRHTPEVVERCDTGNKSYPPLRSSVMRKRVMAVSALVLIASMLTIYSFYHAKMGDSGSSGFRFWAATAFIGVWLLFAIVHVLRKGP